MEIFDIINGLFQLGAGFALLGNVHNLWKSKEVKGVSVYTQFYIVSWGIFAVPYFIRLGQTFSYMTSIFVLAVNTTWFLQILYYKNQEKLKGETTMCDE